MSDYPYGNNYGMPSSRPPEPPLRSDSWDASPAFGGADQNASAPVQPEQPVGTDAVAGEHTAALEQQPNGHEFESVAEAADGIEAAEGAYPAVDIAGNAGDRPSTVQRPIASSDGTESFEAARMGDTVDMPPVSAEPVAAAAQRVQTPAEDVFRQRSSQQVGSVGGQGYQGFQEYRQQPSSGSYGYQAPTTPKAVRPSQTSAKKSGTAVGKTFLFGFLGALVACVLAIGGFAIANGGIGRNQASSALIGTTDQTVINAVDEGQTLAEAVAAKALPSVVAVYQYQEVSSGYGGMLGYGYGTQGSDSLVAVGMGSGVVISDDGYIITNYHVVEDAKKLTVSVDGKERDATYVGGDNSSDVAVIKVEDTSGLVAADIGDSDDLRIGEWVMTIGAPLGLEQSVATGVVSATNRGTVMDSSTSSNDPYAQMFGYGNSNPEYVYYPNMIQTDAVINPGNSGGALVDADGKLIGINAIISSQSGDYAGVGFAIPINYAIGLAKDIIDGKEPTHAMLGVSLSQVNATIAQRYNLSADKGAYVSAITPGTGAADSDLKVGDIITAIDGKQVASATDVTLDIRAHKVGDTVKVTVNRGGETVDVDVKLTSDKDLAASENKDQKDQQQDQQQQQQQNGRDQRGNGGGYSAEEIEELLKMLSM